MLIICTLSASLAAVSLFPNPRKRCSKAIPHAPPPLLLKGGKNAPFRRRAGIFLGAPAHSLETRGPARLRASAVTAVPDCVALSKAPQKAGANGHSLKGHVAHIKAALGAILKKLLWTNTWLKLIAQLGAAFVLACAIRFAAPKVAIAARSSGRCSGRSSTSRSSSSRSSRSGRSSSRRYSSGRSSYGYSHSSPGSQSTAFKPWSNAGAGSSRTGVSIAEGDVAVAKGDTESVEESVMWPLVGAVVGLLALGTLVWQVGKEPAMDPTSVVQLQVALLGSDPKLLQELKVNGEGADTASQEGLHALLTGTAALLLDCAHLWMLASSKAVTASKALDAQALYEQLSLEERAKSEKETFVNESGKVARQKLQPPPEEPPRGTEEYVLVSILAELAGEVALAELKSTADLRHSLTAVKQTRQQSVQAVDVVWVPEEEGDTLTREDLLATHPHLLVL